METYRIPETNLAGLHEQIAKLNKRATKLKVTPVRLVVDHWETVEGTYTGPFGDTIPYTARYCHLSIVGTTPKLQGWTFTAVIQPTEAGNLVKLVPGTVENIPAWFYEAKMTCDHCKMDRQRNEVFVLHHEGGGWAQVGRTCIQDFLGGVSPERLLNEASYLMDSGSLMREAEDEGWGRGSGGWVEPTEPTEVYVSTCAAFVRFEGFVSKAQSQLPGGGDPTSARAWMWLNPSKHDRDEIAWLQHNGFAVEERDITLAAKAIAWAQQLTNVETNNFLANLKVSASRTIVDGKSIGLMAALVGAYMREVEREELRRKERETMKPSAYVGEVGQRLTLPQLTITNVRTFDSDYGVRTMVKLIDPDGNQFTWWTGYAPDWVEQSAVVTIKATVKKFEEYRGIKGTVITRAAIV